MSYLKGRDYCYKPTVYTGLNMAAGSPPPPLNYNSKQYHLSETTSRKKMHLRPLLDIIRKIKDGKSIQKTFCGRGRRTIMGASANSISVSSSSSRSKESLAGGRGWSYEEGSHSGNL
ncbi:hypothetical protein SAY87_015461 [Trapa incisa]|uniref:Uncharacterized protein n=1 Tax=Trapa incisa TaxID=236973 RepID=A0AAN7GZE6_9MYRT|nr:hypothetical protein SAY87_015461 [Trapa incisa]